MTTGSQVNRTPSAGAGQAPPPHKFVKWHGRVLAICFALFALELGLFLLVFPWLHTWDLNWVPLRSAPLRTVWMSPYLRGALSGLGLLNLYVGVAELGKQMRLLFLK